MKYSDYAIPWGGRDVLKVFAVVLLGGIGCYVVLVFMIGNYKWIVMAARYAGALLAGIVPYTYVRRKYRLNANLLGFQRGNYKLVYSVLVAICVALISAIVVYFFSFSKDVPVFPYGSQQFSLFKFVLFPLSIEGMATVLIVPFGEEILMRGFLYGYLRRKTGVMIGLLMQSLVFALFHCGSMNDNVAYLIISEFYIGLTFGVIYEYSNSIYPAMACHSIYNYVIAFMGVFAFL